MKGVAKDSPETCKWNLNSYPTADFEGNSVSSSLYEYAAKFRPDPYLGEMLENLKQRISKEECAIGYHLS